MPEVLSTAVVGRTFDPVTVRWKPEDVMLYALGVGATPEAELDFLYEGRGPKVLPTYGVIPGMRALGGLVGAVALDFLKVLHGEQGIVCHRPLPPEGTASVTGRIEAVWDKGSAAVVVVAAEVADEHGPLCTTRSSLFVRDAGGFGGERGPSGGPAAPERPPDHVHQTTTGPAQAALYRLSGDRNPLHIDPEVAKAAGFDRPFLHGLCTYGIVGRAVLAAACEGDPARFGGLEGRFAERVYPGDTVTTELWELDEGQLAVRARTPAGVVLSHGRAWRR
ncbi:MaoC/PaaZ C-terminal domain-containing protein [Aciditerrimonas ferrireducens]|uniref:MaoC/PaaZ C-terminal domain-containing protein n=1 Tax=Aciditerrimonas ferrireducens TaxID=667306 RepID=UPI002005C786|nr:MaoC/PaaZ C-terminal domain-containing protein [Aciditerrimonas ferrireducens]MCK4178167.1 MaoC family dehydratase N-terminal domain-containing protein [Aciditerrimonas ferrireducens]